MNYAFSLFAFWAYHLLSSSFCSQPSDGFGPGRGFGRGMGRGMMAGRGFGDFLIRTFYLKYVSEELTYLLYYVLLLSFSQYCVLLAISGIYSSNDSLRACCVAYIFLT